MVDNCSFGLTVRLWRDYEFIGPQPPFEDWQEIYVWNTPSFPGCTMSYYKAPDPANNSESEWVIMWDETEGTGKLKQVWRVM